MIFSMRTTLDLPDPLFKEIKTRAVQQGVKLKELLAHYIQAGMNAPHAAAVFPPSQAVPLPYFRSAAGPTIPTRSNAELLAILEEDEIAQLRHAVNSSQPQP
jgi:hypothetical protein